MKCFLIRLPLNIAQRWKYKIQYCEIKENSQMGCVSSNFRKSFQRTFTRTSSYDPINPVFGVALINVLCSEKSPYVAKIVVECVEFIEQDENITNEHIYSVLRPLSDSKKIDKLKQKVFACVWFTVPNTSAPFHITFDQIHVDGNYDAIKSQDVCVVADVLRQFFKELRPSIIPTTSFEAAFAMQTGAYACLLNAHSHMNISWSRFIDFRTDESLIELIKYLRRLDAETFDTLKYLIRHLYT